jgi:hypothetical protein
MLFYCCHNVTENVSLVAATYHVQKCELRQTLCNPGQDKTGKRFARFTALLLILVL